VDARMKTFMLVINLCLVVAPKIPIGIPLGLDFMYTQIQVRIKSSLQMGPIPQ
jgi:hypothetical protein